MYYYVFENIRSFRQRRQINKVKQSLAQLGIAGENVTPSPARTLDELLTAGLTKGYSTIVSIGQDAFLQRTVSFISKKYAPDPKPIVGLVPLEPEKSSLKNLIKTQDLNASLEAIKFRRFISLDLPSIEPKKFFIIPAIVVAQHEFRATLTTPSYQLNARVSMIEINSDMAITLKPPQASLVQRLFGSKNAQSSNLTQIKAGQVTIETEKPTPVVVGDQIIAKTPIVVKMQTNRLRLIIGRSMI